MQESPFHCYLWGLIDCIRDNDDPYHKKICIYIYVYMYYVYMRRSTIISHHIPSVFFHLYLNKDLQTESQRPELGFLEVTLRGG